MTMTTYGNGFGVSPATVGTRALAGGADSSTVAAAAAAVPSAGAVATPAAAARSLRSRLTTRLYWSMPRTPASASCL